MEIQNITTAIENLSEESFHFLEKIVNIDSPSRDREAVNRVGKEVTNYLKENDISFEILPNEKEYGDHILAKINGTKPGKILLMGHMDTVYPLGTVAERPFTKEGDYIYGPACSDMKPGLVSMLSTAKAFKDSEVEMCDIELLFTPDEEIGSPSSRTLIEERAKDAIAVFNLEAGRPDGSLVTARRGSAHLKFHIKGKSAHSGVTIEDGISAIEEMSFKVLEMRKLMDLNRGLTINVGTVEGGINTNVVAPEATGAVHIGFRTKNDFDEIMTNVQSIIDTSYIPGTKSSITSDLSFMPMEKHEGVEELYEIVQEAGSILDIPITEQHVMGAADAGFTASIGVPTVCGMGAVGGDWHKESEYMIADTFIERMKLLAVSMMLVSENTTHN